MDRSRQQFLPTADSATKTLFYSTRMLRNVFISKFNLQLPWTYDTWENILNRPVAKTKHKSNYALRTALCIWAVGGTMHSLGGWHPHGRSQETCPSTQHPQPGVPLKWDKHISSLKYISSIYAAHQKQTKMTVMLKMWKPCRCLNPPKSLF